MRKTLIPLGAAICLAVLTFQTVAVIFLCEGALHLKHKPLTASMRANAANDTEDLDAKIEDVHIASFDGVRLAAWFFRPSKGNGDTVIVLHGHGDNRGGTEGFAPMLLRHQYAVLVPDSRAHGESGGNIATYGLYESRDLTLWVNWLATQNYHGCVYELGESMGAAILLQALPNEPRFCAVAAESPYASFRQNRGDS